MNPAILRQILGKTYKNIEIFQILGYTVIILFGTRGSYMDEEIQRFVGYLENVKKVISNTVSLTMEILAR